MYAAALPEHLVSSVAAFFNSPEACQSLSEIAVGRGRIAELLQRIKDHGGGTWKEVSDAWDEFQAVANDKNSTPEDARRAAR